MMDFDTANTPASLRIGQAYVSDYEKDDIITDAVSEVSADTFLIGSASNTDFLSASIAIKF